MKNLKGLQIADVASAKENSTKKSKYIKGTPVIVMMSSPNPTYRAEAVLDMPDTWPEKRTRVENIQIACTTNPNITFTPPHG